MFPAPFDYHTPTTLDEAVELLVRHGPEAKLLAGGASLIPLMKLRLAEPGHLVDLGRVPGLDGIAAGPASIALGAMVREAALAASHTAAPFGALADAVTVIADPSVRNVGTIGGNVAHGDPANDQPAVLLALGAMYRARGPGGERTIPASAFHVGMLETVLRPDEILVAIELPAPGPATGSAYVKVERQVGDFAIAAAAAVITLDPADPGRIAGATLALTNLAPTPVRAAAAEAGLAGSAASAASLEAAAALVDGAIDPWDDLRATAAVKRSIARTVARRALERALARAQERARSHERTAGRTAGTDIRTGEAR